MPVAPSPVDGGAAERGTAVATDAGGVVVVAAVVVVTVWVVVLAGAAGADSAGADVCCSFSAGTVPAAATATVFTWI